VQPGAVQTSAEGRPDGVVPAFRRTSPPAQGRAWEADTLPAELLPLGSRHKLYQIAREGRKEGTPRHSAIGSIGRWRAIDGAPRRMVRATIGGWRSPLCERRPVTLGRPGRSSSSRLQAASMESEGVPIVCRRSRMSCDWQPSENWNARVACHAGPGPLLGCLLLDDADDRVEEVRS
jgi:hypothetical protein